MTDAQKSIKEAVGKATLYRKTQTQAHTAATKAINKKHKSIIKNEDKVNVLQVQLENDRSDKTKAQGSERKAAKQIIAVDNLTRKFLSDLDDVETGKKQTIAA